MYSKDYTFFGSRFTSFENNPPYNPPLDIYYIPSKGGVPGNFENHWSPGCICSLTTNDFRSFQTPRPPLRTGGTRTPENLEMTMYVPAHEPSPSTDIPHHLMNNLTFRKPLLVFPQSDPQMKFPRFRKLLSANERKKWPTSGRVVLGRDTVIRENTVVQCPVMRKQTFIGAASYLMSNVVVGHDCHLGKHVTVTQNCSIGGFVLVGDGVQLGQGCQVHQFTTIGSGAFIGMQCVLNRDVPPRAVVALERGEVVFQSVNGEEIFRDDIPGGDTGLHQGDVHGKTTKSSSSAGTSISGFYESLAVGAWNSRGVVEDHVGDIIGRGGTASSCSRTTLPREFIDEIGAFVTARREQELVPLGSTSQRRVVMRISVRTPTPTNHRVGRSSDGMLVATVDEEESPPPRRALLLSSEGSRKDASFVRESSSCSQRRAASTTTHVTDDARSPDMKSFAPTSASDRKNRLASKPGPSRTDKALAAIFRALADAGLRHCAARSSAPSLTNSTNHCNFPDLGLDSVLAPPFIRRLQQLLEETHDSSESGSSASSNANGTATASNTDAPNGNVADHVTTNNTESVPPFRRPLVAHLAVYATPLALASYVCKEW